MPSLEQTLKCLTGLLHRILTSVPKQHLPSYWRHKRIAALHGLAIMSSILQRLGSTPNRPDLMGLLTEIEDEARALIVSCPTINTGIAWQHYQADQLTIGESIQLAYAVVHQEQAQDNNELLALMDRPTDAGPASLTAIKPSSNGRPVAGDGSH
jgi:hypothetical protein